MPKKIDKETEIIPEVIQPTDYLKSEGEKLDILRGTTHPSGEQVETIITLFNKYISDKRVRKDGCSSCNDGIKSAYWELISWFVKNREKFIN